MFIYRKINEIFDIKDLLDTNNPLKKDLGITDVKYDKNANSTGSNALQVRLKDKFGDHRVLLFNRDKTTGEIRDYYTYYNATVGKQDTGDIIQFIKNRKNFKTSEEIENYLKTFNFEENAPKWKQNVNIQHAYHKKQRKKKPFDLKDFPNIRSITEVMEREKPHYLEIRGISNDVLTHENFIDKVLLYEHKDKYHNTNENIFFPKYSFGEPEIKGGEVKTTYKRDYAFGPDQLLWNSNKPKEVSNIFISESALDSLSHFQLDPERNANTWYFSTNGNLYKERVEELYSVLKASKIDLTKTPLIIGVDNDFDGFKYELEIINKTLQFKGSKVKPEFSIGHQNGKPSLVFKSIDKDLNNQVSTYFFKVQDHLNNIYMKNSENNFVSVNMKKEVSLVFPNRQKLERVSTSLGNSLLKNITKLSNSQTYIKKPSFGKDWNDTLKNKLKNSEKAINKLKQKLKSKK